jgi:predicted GTPase
MPRLVSMEVTALSDSVDSLKSQMKVERARSTELETLIVDMEATISQFRDLVASLQRCVIISDEDDWADF